MARIGSAALAQATRHLNAPLPAPIAAETALAWFRDQNWSASEEIHARSLIDETDPYILLDLVIDGLVTYGQLASCAARLLPPQHDTRLWLDERRQF